MSQQNSRDYLREHLREVPSFRALVRSVECRLFEQVGQLEEPILDVGCGDGLFASLSFEKRLFAGIDPNEASVREARVRSRERASRGGHEHLIIASAIALPFHDQFFKTVVANCVIEHIEDLDRALSEVKRVLKPDGRFVFGVPSHRFAEMLLAPTLLRSLGLRSMAARYGNWFNDHSRHFHTYDPADWRGRLAKYGFTIDHWEYYLTPAAHRAFDVAHYLSIPRLITRKITGKWVLFQNPVSSFLVEKWLRRHYETLPDGEGPYIFFQTRKTA